MIFLPTQLDGAWLIRPEPKRDSRGFFARTWCRDEYAAMNLDSHVAQQSLSYTSACGALRGLHFQREPDQETKIVRCIHGAIFDVIVDLRPLSPTYLKWQAFELTAENRDSLYIPKGFAHGYQTLAADCEVAYQMSEPLCAAGRRRLSPRRPRLRDRLAAAGQRHQRPRSAVARLPRPLQAVLNQATRNRRWGDATLGRPMLL